MCFFSDLLACHYSVDENPCDKYSLLGRRGRLLCAERLSDYVDSVGRDGRYNHHQYSTFLYSARTKTPARVFLRRRTQPVGLLLFLAYRVRGAATSIDVLSYI